MGSILGISSHSVVPHEMLIKPTVDSIYSFDIWKFHPHFSISTPYNASEINRAYKDLAKYIGIMGDEPKNEIKADIEMMLPVLLQDAFDLVDKTEKGREVLKTGEFLMSFFLPNIYKKIHEIPKPVANEVLYIASSDLALLAVRKFSGFVRGVLERKYRIVVRDLKNELKEVFGHHEEIDKAPHGLAVYDPPWTLPWFRHNEVWVKLDHIMTHEDILDKISKDFRHFFHLI